MDKRKTFKNYKSESRIDWGAYVEDGETINRDQIQLGAILRIADASELMAKNHAELVRERDYYQRMYKEQYAYARHLERRVAGLRGQITVKNRVIEELGSRAK